MSRTGLESKSFTNTLFWASRLNDFSRRLTGILNGFQIHVKQDLRLKCPRYKKQLRDYEKFRYDPKLNSISINKKHLLSVDDYEIEYYSMDI